MVYCRTHSRYHKGVSAKGACMLAILKKKDFKEMFGKVKNMNDVKRIKFFEDVKGLWEPVADFKDTAERKMLLTNEEIDDHILSMQMKGIVEVDY